MLEDNLYSVGIPAEFFVKTTSICDMLLLYKRRCFVCRGSMKHMRSTINELHGNKIGYGSEREGEGNFS